MESNTLTKQINVGISKQQTYNNVLTVSKTHPFSLISEDKILGKVLLNYSTSQVEVYVEGKSDTESNLRISILDKDGSRSIVPEIAENAMANFENAFSAVANGAPQAYIPVEFKVSSGKAINGIVSFVSVVIAILVLLYIIMD